MVDGRSKAIQLSRLVLQDDGVGGPGHGMHVGVLQGGDPGVGGNGVEEHDLEKPGNIREKTQQMVQIFRRQSVAQSPAVQKFAG